jgi:hypothetical protein
MEVYFIERYSQKLIAFSGYEENWNSSFLNEVEPFLMKNWKASKSEIIKFMLERAYQIEQEFPEAGEELEQWVPAILSIKVKRLESWS